MLATAAVATLLSADSVGFVGIDGVGGGSDSRHRYSDGSCSSYSLRQGTKREPQNRSGEELTNSTPEIHPLPLAWTASTKTVSLLVQTTTIFWSPDSRSRARKNAPGALLPPCCFRCEMPRRFINTRLPVRISIAPVLNGNKRLCLSALSPVT